jgi:tetratricopeptide (TPR) repeat protein
MVLRLFQRRYSFKGAVHEYVSIEDPTKVGYALHPVIYHTAVPSAERHTRRGRNIGLLKQALAQNPTSPYLQYYLGTEWLGVGRADLAISAFQQALLYFSPEQVVFRSPAVHHLISSYQSAGKLDEAICLCLQESQQYPEYCDLFFAGGILFELRNQYEIAIKWFQAAAKSTLPPLPFFHTDGTNSYLAYYHLGYCAEKLGLSTEAQKYYEQALKTNKNYYYPLYQLVLLKLTHQNALEVLSFLKEGNYLVIPQVAEKMAELFCTAGFPDVGIQCLGSRISSPVANVELAIRCQLYSGEISLALQSITQLRQDGLQPTTIVAVDEIIALLMSKRFDEGRQRMLDFWQRKNKRDAFRAVFCLYKKLRHGTLLPLSNLDSATTLFELQDRCLHVRAKSFHEQQCFATLLAAIRSILANDEQTVTLLLHNLQEKEQVTIQQLDYTFTALRGLYR